jgi:nitrilase
MALHAGDKVAAREPDGDGPQQAFLAEMARVHRLFVIGGSVPLACDDPARTRQSLLVYAPGGERRRGGVALGGRAGCGAATGRCTAGC